MNFKDALDTLADDAKPLKAAVLLALSDATAEQMRLFHQLWGDIAVARRRSVVHRLAEIAEDNEEADFRAVLRTCLTDPDAEVRAVAIEGLWEEESPSLAEVLAILLLNDPSARVRAAAAEGLQPFALRAVTGELKGNRPSIVRTALLAALVRPGEELEVRCNALKSVGYWEDGGVREAIAAGYRSQDPHLKASAIHAMGINLAPAWRKTILAELESLNPEVRYEAAESAGEMELPDAVPLLIKLLQDADSEVRLSAIGALGMSGGPAAKKALQECAKSKNEVLREAAEVALEELLFFADPLTVPKGGIEVAKRAKKG